MKAGTTQVAMLMAAVLISAIGIGQGINDRDRNDLEPYNSNRNSRNQDEFDYQRGSDYNRGFNNHGDIRPVVRYRPQAPRQSFRGRQPSRFHIWIGTEYIWRSGRYIDVPGYWLLPPSKNVRFVAGHWSRTRGGFVWVAGFWTPMNNRSGWY